MDLALVFVTAVALAFAYVNGFHDAANSIATVVSTRVLKPYQAVLLAATFNFTALFIFHLSVAATVGKGIVDAGVVDHYLVFGALIGAIAWNLITWYYGLPSSSSHALIGGLVGAAVAKAGTWALLAPGILKTVAFIFISPFLGMTLGALMMLAVSWICARSSPSKVDRWFRRLQLVSASAYSLGHGGNDAQKTVGIIWMLLIAGNYLGADDPIPYWVVVACYVTIALGTAFGGWRIVKTMGQRITKLKPVGGFCAETGGAITLFATGALRRIVQRFFGGSASKLVAGLVDEGLIDPDEVRALFGVGSARRQTLILRLGRIYRAARATGHLMRFVVFGSFVTRKPEPQDVDLFLRDSSDGEMVASDSGYESIEDLAGQVGPEVHPRGRVTMACCSARASAGTSPGGTSVPCGSASASSSKTPTRLAIIHFPSDLTR